MKILVFSKTAGFRHQSIPEGINAIKKLAVENDFEVVATGDASIFQLAELQKYQAVVFLSTTGDVLNPSQQAEFEKYIRQGGGFVGIHAASDTEYDWPWYGKLVGAYFDSHPPGTPAAVVKVSDRVHPSTKNLPFVWPRTDEWYNYKNNPRGQVHVLATLDESSYSGGTMGTDHPIAWCHNFEGGRAWYTGGGHTVESYSDTNFVNHLYGGILYAAGIVSGVFDATVESNYELTIIDSKPAQAIALEVLPDGKVLYIERAGKIKLYDPSTAAIAVAGTLSVDNQRGDGLLGIALDPDFKLNNWIYLFYSPAGLTPEQRVSRFTFVNNKFDMSSEKVLLKIPVQRELCCHSGGYMIFDANKNLLIATGDNTNPFESDGYSTIDERRTRTAYDAQRTAANSRDLRGKILKIKPLPDGTYSIPSGNLFTSLTDGAPEIFVMGCRNPYRMSTDSKRGYLYWGDVGPDKTGDGPRGPQGYDEINRTKISGNFGWPYCIADNKSYRDYDFASTLTGNMFDCSNPVNESPNNTGIRNLPPAIPAWIWYSYSGSPEFPQLGTTIGGRTAMTGPVYNFDSSNASSIKMPAYFDGSLFIYDWSNNWIREIKMNDSGDIVNMNPVFNMTKFVRPMDMKVGPDGAFYFVEWGSSYWEPNPDARIIKIGFKSGSRNPVAVISQSEESGSTPLKVSFSAEKSYDPDGNTLTYFWDFDNDGMEDANSLNAEHIYTTPGIYTAKLRVADNIGQQSVAFVEIVAGNNKPDVKFHLPSNGGFFDWSDSIQYNVIVSDKEEGSTDNGGINCSTLSIIPAIGHNDHGHDENKLTGCEGIFKAANGHGAEDAADNIFYVISGSYKDKGLVGSTNYSLTGNASVVLHPKRVQAEFLKTQANILKAPSNDPSGGNLALIGLRNMDTAFLSPVRLENIHQITFRAKAYNGGGIIILRSDSMAGPILAQRTIPAENNYDYYTIPLPQSLSTNKLVIVFKSANGSSLPFVDLNWIDFYGNGISRPHPEKHGLYATYYQNIGFSGQGLERSEPLISHLWENKTYVQNIPADNFSVKWKGFIKAPVTADYTFAVPVKNGNAELYLSDLKVLSTLASDKNKYTIRLTEGSFTPLEIRYSHTNDTAAVKLEWSYSGNLTEAVPEKYLVPTDYLTTGTGNESLIIEEVKVYPNPFSDVINVSGPEGREFSMTLIDAYGNQVFQSKSALSGKLQIKIPSLTEGLYIVRIKSDQNSFVYKLVRSSY